MIGLFQRIIGGHGTWQLQSLASLLPDVTGISQRTLNATATTAIQAIQKVNFYNLQNYNKLMNFFTNFEMVMISKRTSGQSNWT